MRHLALAFLAAACTGCIVYPKEVSTYDSDCGVRSRYLTLEAEYIWGDCGGTAYFNDEFAQACLAIIAGSAVASTVISGSIVIVGNTIYWLEKQERCLRKGGA